MFIKFQLYEQFICNRNKIKASVILILNIIVRQNSKTYILEYDEVLPRILRYRFYRGND